MPLQLQQRALATESSSVLRALRSSKRLVLLTVITKKTTTMTRKIVAGRHEQASTLLVTDGMSPTDENKRSPPMSAASHVRRGESRCAVAEHVHDK
jgi:hypothetical protein